MTTFELPVEIWDIIAKFDLKTYYQLVRAIPIYGRRMSHPLLNRAMRIHFTVCTTDENGDREWYLHGKIHREDGPAYESVGGTRSWWLHGKRHRDDGPAVEWASGDRLWYLHGNHYRPGCWDESIK